MEHARRVGRAAGDLGGRATRGRPRWRGGQHDVHHQGGEGQGDEPPDECRPLGAVVQPQHPGNHVRQHEERHVDAADDHFPPRWLRQLDVLLQPHRGDGAEEQPSVGVRLELPEGACAQRVSGAAAQVVEHQHQCEREPVADHREHLVSPSDAGGDQPARDVHQQQLPVEREPVRRGSVDHHRGPGGDGATPRPGQPTVAAGWVGRQDRRGGVRRPAGASGPSRPGRWIGLQKSNPAVGCHCHWANLIRRRPFSIRSFSLPCRIYPMNRPNTLSANGFDGRYAAAVYSLGVSAPQWSRSSRASH